MAQPSKFKTFSAGETLTAADLNSSLDQVFDNQEDLGWPATKSRDINGNEFILDADADTSITVDTDDRIDFKIAGNDGVHFGHATGNTTAFVHIDPGAFSSTASTDIALLRVGNTNAVTIPAGTTTLAAGAVLEAPNLTATGTITNSATLYIAGAATEATNDYAFWVDAGDCRFDETVTITGVTTHGGNVVSDTDSTDDLGTTSVRWANLFVDAITATDTINVAGTGAVTGVATQAQMETATSVVTWVTPGRQHFHPGVAKAWANFDGTGTPSLSASYGVDSISDDNTGRHTLTWTTAFSTANYAVAMMGSDGVAGNDETILAVVESGRAAGTMQVQCVDVSGTADDVDRDDLSIVAFGDFA